MFQAYLRLDAVQLRREPSGRQRVVIGRRCGFGAVCPGAIRLEVSRNAV
jgi:hypothetical protein